MDLLERVIRIGLKCIGTTGRLAAIEEEPSSIRYINNPSEAEQLAALKDTPLYIEFIKNPTPSAQSFAVNQDARAIRYIKNPTEGVAMLAKLSE